MAAEPVVTDVYVSLEGVAAAPYLRNYRRLPPVGVAVVAYWRGRAIVAIDGVDVGYLPPGCDALIRAGNAHGVVTESRGGNEPSVVVRLRR